MVDRHENSNGQNPRKNCFPELLEWLGIQMVCPKFQSQDQECEWQKQPYVVALSVPYARKKMKGTNRVAQHQSNQDSLKH